MDQNMSGFKCIACQQEIPDGQKYACVWIKEAGGLRIAFAHMKCSEQFEDITEEMAGYKKEAEEKIKGSQG
jgi:hypothetical protein